MGRHSKGCQTCIKRRVKCDEETPVCYQCVSSGFECAGPVKGPIFVDMLEGVRRKSTRPVTKHSNKDHPKTALHNPLPNSEVSSSTSDPAKRMHILSQGSKLPPLQPSRRDIFQDLYIANFISAQDATINPWVAELPNLISTSASTSSSEFYGIRAATLALYAKLSHDTDLEIEAAKWYSKGLVAQRRELQLAARTQKASLCHHKSISAAVMFVHFESVICTVPIGWMQHYAAAIKMFELAGPENCQTGLIHMFFRLVRVAAFTISLTADELSVLASEEWCTVPFFQSPSTPFDDLISILLKLPSCLPIRNEMRKNGSSNPTKAEALRRQLDITAKHILNRLDDFWSANKENIDPSYDIRMQATSLSSPSPLSHQNELDSQPKQPWSPVMQQFAFQSSSNAYFTSMYDIGKVIILRVLAACSTTTTQSDEYAHAAWRHGASILAAAAYCETQGEGNVSFSMVFPLKTLCLLSPEEGQRVLARSVLLMWGEERGLVGMCKVAAPSYLDRSHG